MRVCVFGSRAYPNPGDVAEYVMSLPADTIVVEGCAGGPDAWAGHVAADVCRCPVPCRHWPPRVALKVEPYPANWSRDGKAAGPHRNALMVARADRGLGFWDGRSKGTKDCADKFAAALKPVTLLMPQAKPEAQGLLDWDAREEHARRSAKYEGGGREDWIVGNGGNG